MDHPLALVIVSTVTIMLVLFALLPKYLYADLLSLTNMLCGAIAIFYIYLDFQQPVLIGVPIFVMCGQFADLFDGKAAQKWGSTANGELWDDAADFTSFGLATGVFVFKVLASDLHITMWFSVVKTIIYIVSILFRLVRFVVNKRKAGIVGGVKHFEGVPSPVGASMVFVSNCIFELLLKNYPGLATIKIVKIAYCVFVDVVCFLTVSTIKYPHMSRVSIRRDLISKKLINVFYIFCIGCYIFSAVTRIYEPALYTAFFYLFGYFTTPLYEKRINMFVEDKPREKKEEKK